MKRLFLAVLLISISAYAQAKELRKDIGDKLDQCKKVALNTIDSSNCYTSASAEWDSELNKQYNLLIKDQNKEVQDNLRNSQRAWVKYKDSYINAMTSFYRQQQGTVWGLALLESKLEVTRDKAIDLYRLRNSTNMSGEED